MEKNSNYNHYNSNTWEYTKTLTRLPSSTVDTERINCFFCNFNFKSDMCISKFWNFETGSRIRTVKP